MNPLTQLFPQLLQIGKVQYVDKKILLLNEGEICDKVFLLEKGIVRSWINHDGNDITFQFFFENDIVTSFESLKNSLPALSNFETITPCRLRMFSKGEMQQLLNENNALKQYINDYLVTRLYHYQRLFISRIKLNPQQRYAELLAEQPHIFERVPHYYIASYLGITPVSLSRIRAKNANAINKGK